VPDEVVKLGDSRSLADRPRRRLDFSRMASRRGLRQHRLSREAPQAMPAESTASDKVASRQRVLNRTT